MVTSDEAISKRDARNRSAPADRRVRRTRRALRDALLDLVPQVGYGAITVDALVQRADLARATFYAHYRDIDALLEELVQVATDDVLRRVAPLARAGDPIVGAVERELCRHALEQRPLYRVILSGAADGHPRALYSALLAGTAQELFARGVEEIGATPSLPVGVVAEAWAGCFVALLEWWTFDEPERDADEVALIACRLLVHGFAWAIGLGELSVDADAFSRPLAPAPGFEPPAGVGDRRVRRSRAALHDALYSLMSETPYRQITVEALTERADVSRATFYAHYRDIDDLLTSIVRAHVDELVAQMDSPGLAGPALDGTRLRRCCAYLDAHRATYKVVFSDAADGAARAVLTSGLGARTAEVFLAAREAAGRSGRVDETLVARAFVGSFVALCAWWMREEPERRGDEVALFATELLARGFLPALGASNVSLDETAFTARPSSD